MARPGRIEYPGAVYQVTARGNNHRRAFRGGRERPPGGAACKVPLHRDAHYRLVEPRGPSVTRAAAILAVTPSAVSPSFRRLRHHMLKDQTLAATLKELNYNVTI